LSGTWKLLFRAARESNTPQPMRSAHTVPGGKSGVTPPGPKIMSPASQCCGYPGAPSIPGFAAWREVEFWEITPPRGSRGPVQEQREGATPRRVLTSRRCARRRRPRFQAWAARERIARTPRTGLGRRARALRRRRVVNLSEQVAMATNSTTLVPLRVTPYNWHCLPSSQIENNTPRSKR
jgi:hypothetical protein